MKESSGEIAEVSEADEVFLRNNTIQECIVRGRMKSRSQKKIRRMWFQTYPFRLLTPGFCFSSITL
jgi:hypothetical protein